MLERIDTFNRKLGHATAWFALVLVLLQFSVVVLRYVFSVGFAPMQEAVWYLHGLLFMLGAGYTFLQDEHVRVDVIYRQATPIDAIEQSRIGSRPSRRTGRDSLQDLPLQLVLCYTSGQ